ncbi:MULTISPECIES: ABC transporter substrate-binding protein [Streptomyces]|jgi:iron complex transport system substrate-binding protein|uniref:ABC transporter substrate-binding protein n=2 Tax=Streptomyces TaxID=1883 RepID=A0A514JSQ6_9ACTN|nr:MULTISPECIES: iron-siderophore ABC transporter substrate-binding protein [Streptomyces]MBA8943558.1 iron complex transport system substrate-binding protein [Streptomyces calvus]MBA8977183.1 iron complex transport system substrate-binding protein [Streptomyces calvus]MYS31821.1 ABC transporter substrate-binding protein [Streptomyces sp. SID7804]QDI69982.1 ABC transporter substrate-binding protein [Streptomyces calvus]GGP39644.1 ABC transporter periplasmic component [Streptomyces calvus]
MSVRRRGLSAAALALAAALSLSACGSSGGEGASAESSAGAGDKKAVAQGGDDFADAAAKTAAMGTDAEPGEWPRTITHAMGETELKAQPRRVVVLDVGELDNVVSLGIEPVGLAPTEGSPELPSYLKDDAGSPKNVGTINNLNLEAIAALEPDLILGSQLRAADKYDELSQIAPTVFSLRPGFTWKENYLLNAAALDRTAEAKQKLAAYEKKAKALGEQLGADKPTVSMVRYLPDGVIRLYANASFIGTILKDAGIPRPKNQDIDDLAAEISAENIDQADADYIFTGVYGDPKATDKSKAQGNPLWKNLGAVKAGHAFDVPDETWYLGLGVTAAEEVLADLEQRLTQ